MNYKLKIRKKDILDKTLFFMLIIQVMAIRWMNYTLRYSYVFLILFLIHFLVHIKGYYKLGKGFVSFLIILVYFWISASQNTSVGLQNFKMILPSICSFLFVGYLINNRKYMVSNYFYKCALIFNIYYLINIPVLLMELGGNLSLAGKHPAGVTNPMKEDLICGLLGYNGTPLLGLYIAFMTTLNTDICKKIRRQNFRLVFAVYNISVLAFMLWISTQNDNKACFLLIILFVAIYALFDVYTGSSKSIVTKIKGVTKYLLSTVIGLFLIYNILIRIDATNKIIVSIIRWVTEGFNLGAKATGSAERMGAIVYILNDPIHRFFGYGLGNYTWRQNNAFGFYHFGQNDLSVFLILGGIIFTALILFMIYCLVKENTKSVLLSVAFLILSLILMIYTQLLTEYSSMCILLFFYVLCSLKCKGLRKE